MKTILKLALLLLVGFALMSNQRAAAQEPSKWTLELSLYGLAAAMDGEVTIRGIDADLDVPFSEVWDNLEFGAMGSVRVGYDRWAFRTEVVYMGLGASKNAVSADMDQWLVEPTVSYKVCKNFEPYAGARYNNLSGEIRGTGPLGVFRSASGTQDWWDPIVGANVYLPFAKRFSFNVRGDLGGFGISSDLTWQAFPYLSWQFTKWGSLQAGYRFVGTDYETDSGASEFRYDVVTHGPQLGLTLHF